MFTTRRTLRNDSDPNTQDTQNTNLRQRLGKRDAWAHDRKILNWMKTAGPYRSTIGVLDFIPSYRKWPTTNKQCLFFLFALGLGGPRGRWGSMQLWGATCGALCMRFFRQLFVVALSVATLPRHPIVQCYTRRASGLLEPIFRSNIGVGGRGRG